MDEQEMRERDLYWSYWTKQNLGRTIQVTEGDEYSANFSRVGWRGKIIGYLGLLRDGDAALAIDFFDYSKNKTYRNISIVHSTYIKFI